MRERLQKILSARGVCSRRRAEELVAAGRVSCNGVIARLGDSADSEKDVILLDGRPLPPRGDHVYIMLNKPRGYVTTLSDERGRPDAASLVAGCGVRVYPVGRLDMDSEGLLIFTNDGEFANHLMHPRHEVDKTYICTVHGCTPQALERLQQPMTLDGYAVRAPKIRLLGQSSASGLSEMEIIIHEGRNRQVRRMCSIAGMEVVRLKRTAEASLRLGELKPGAWRYLSQCEIHDLKK